MILSTSSRRNTALPTSFNIQNVNVNININVNSVMLTLQNKITNVYFKLLIVTDTIKTDGRTLIPLQVWL